MREVSVVHEDGLVNGWRVSWMEAVVWLWWVLLDDGWQRWMAAVV